MQPTEFNADSSDIAGTSRRKFIGAAAATAAAVNLPISACAQVAGSDELKLALIGCGGRGSGAADQALTSGGTRLVAMADAFSDRLEPALSTLQAKHGSKVDVPDNRKFLGLEAYKEAVQQADVVLLTTPPGFRPMMFQAAVEAGKHIFMEKPVATDSPGIRTVFEYAKKAEEKNLKVVVGLQRRYQKSYIAAKEQVKQGLIGDIIAAQCYWNNAGIWLVDRKPEWSEMYYQVKNWYHFTWVGGDHILEQHIHNIDVINWFMDDQHPVSAQGMGGRELRTDRKTGQIFDHHYVEFVYPNGVIMNSQCRHQPECWNAVKEIIIGSKGTLFIDDSGGAIIRDRAGKTIWRYRRQDQDGNPYQNEHDELYKAIRDNKPLNNAHYGATSTFTAMLGRYATYSGKQVNWDEALAWNNSELPEKLDFATPTRFGPDAEGLYPVPLPGKFDPATSKYA
ncbi:MAG: Gfo/Idh/MocA family oxidoreductase [Verrucomicrobiaceae bacterium]|nr:MAG: Gfo/Idh/MocA family oxidoreductase [Verrucomicrobiaceae bacterium]